MRDGHIKRGQAIVALVLFVTLACATGGFFVTALPRLDATNWRALAWTRVVLQTIPLAIAAVAIARLGNWPAAIAAPVGLLLGVLLSVFPILDLAQGPQRFSGTIERRERVAVTATARKHTPQMTYEWEFSIRTANGQTIELREGEYRVPDSCKSDSTQTMRALRLMYLGEFLDAECRAL